MVSTVEVLRELETYYGRQKPCWPTEPYLFLVWWHCGYPASDESCARGWAALKATVGVELQQILDASHRDLSAALKAGGMVPEVRAMRLKEIAGRVRDEFGGDLSAALRVRAKEARKVLKKFPGIADPGADRILLFGGIAPVAAIPSNCPQVLVRIQQGREGGAYSKTYREAQEMVEAQMAEKFEPRVRAYLLLKKHGQELCKRSKPRCEECPIRGHCAWYGSGCQSRLYQ